MNLTDVTTVCTIYSLTEAKSHYLKILDAMSCGEAVFTGIKTIASQLQTCIGEQQQANLLDREFDLLFEYATCDYEELEADMEASYEEQIQIYLEETKASATPLTFTYPEEYGKRIFRNLENFEHELTELSAEARMRPGKLDMRSYQIFVENTDEVCDGYRILLLIISYCELRALAHQIGQLASAKQSERDFLQQKVQQSQQTVAEQIKMMNIGHYGALSPDIAEYMTMQWLRVLNYTGYVHKRYVSILLSNPCENNLEWIQRNYADVLAGKYQTYRAKEYRDMIHLAQPEKIKAQTSSYTTAPVSETLMRLWEILCAYWYEELKVIPTAKAYTPLEVSQIMQRCFNCHYPDWTFEISDNQYEDSLLVEYKKKIFCVSRNSIPTEIVSRFELIGIIFTEVLYPATLLIDSYQKDNSVSSIEGYQLRATQALIRSANCGQLLPPHSLYYLAASWKHFSNLSIVKMGQALRTSATIADEASQLKDYDMEKVAATVCSLTGDLINYKAIAATNDFASKWHFIIEHIDEPDTIIDALLHRDDIA